MTNSRIPIVICICLLTAVTSVQGQADFADAVFYVAGEEQTDVATGDLDGDGHNDLVVLIGAGDLQVLFNNGDGTFQDAVPYEDLWPDRTIAVKVADLDRDGDNDLAVTFVTTTGSVSVLLNHGDGTFADPVNYDTCISTQPLAVGDLNGDHYPDTASASNCFTAHILLNNGDGSLRDNGGYGTGYSPGGIETSPTPTAPTPSRCCSMTARERSPCTSSWIPTTACGT